MSKTRTTFTTLFLKYGVGLAILALLAWSNWSVRSADGQEVGLRHILLRPVGGLSLFGAAAFASAAAYLTILRWYFLVRAQGLPVTFLNAFRFGLLGHFLNTFLPGSLGGDLVKSVLIAREQRCRTAAVATVWVDRLIGLYGLICVTALVGVLIWAAGALGVMAPDGSARVILESGIVTAVGLCAGSVFVWILLGLVSERQVRAAGRHVAGWPWVGSCLAGVWQIFWLYRRQGGVLAVALAMTVAIHGSSVLAFFAAAQAVCPGTDTPGLPAHLLVIPFGLLVKAGFPTPGGIGGAEFAFGHLYRLVGGSFSAGVLASLLIRTISWGLAVTSYLAYGLIPGPPQQRASLAPLTPDS